jgi:hypothetical protein
LICVRSKGRDGWAGIPLHLTEAKLTLWDLERFFVQKVK